MSATDWEGEFPECIFVRDYEALPDTAPFDVDVLLPETQWIAFCSKMEFLAGKHNLVIISRKHERGLNIALFDVPGSAGCRNWVYYEIHPGLVFSKRLSFYSHDIEKQISGQGLPVPVPHWRFLLLFLQGLRRKKLHVYAAQIDALFADHGQKICDFVNSRTGLSAEDIKSAIRSPHNAGQLQQRLRIILPGKMGRNHTAIGKKIRGKCYFFKKKLEKWLFTYLFFVHRHNPLLFTLHGADGVGKTTISEEIGAIFSRFPVPFVFFHHVSEWRIPKAIKPAKKEKGGKESSMKAQYRPRAFRRFLKAVWKHIPPALKNIWSLRWSWSLIKGELRYDIGVNRLMAGHFSDNKIMLADRYVYDTWIKNLVKKKYARTPLGKIRFVNALLLRRPRLAFFVRDNPRFVFMRKQELSEEDIDKYQKAFTAFLHKTKLPAVVIDVNQRRPHETAAEIAARILKDLGEEVIPLMSKRYL